MKREPIITIKQSSDTPISLDTHLLLLCEMLDAVLEEDIPAPQQEASPDAA
jgi:hypothetical protein